MDFNVSPHKRIELGKVIKNRRIAEKLSIDDVSKLAKVELKYLEMLEKGNVYIINPIILIKLGKILYINYLELYKIVGFVDNISIIRYMTGSEDVITFENEDTLKYK